MLVYGNQKLQRVTKNSNGDGNSNLNVLPPIDFLYCIDIHIAMLIGHKTRRFIIHCENYHMDVDPRQSISAEFFDKNIGANILLPIEFHMVKLAVVHCVLFLCVVGTALTVSMINTSGTEYHSSRRVSYDETKRLTYQQ